MASHCREKKKESLTSLSRKRRKAKAKARISLVQMSRIHQQVRANRSQSPGTKDHVVLHTRTQQPTTGGARGMHLGPTTHGLDLRREAARGTRVVPGSQKAGESEPFSYVVHIVSRMRSYVIMPSCSSSEPYLLLG